MGPVVCIALALAVDAAAGLAGGLLSEGWLRRHLGELVGFAAGALLSVAFLDLLPDAVERLGVYGYVLALFSFSLSAAVSWQFASHPAHGAPEASGALPISLLASDALHNTGDGAAVAAAFLVSIPAGVIAATAIIFHEVPQEVGDYALLRAGGMSKPRALLGLFGVQLTAYLGAAVVLVAAEHAQVVTAVALALAAGTFFYIGATDLLPELRHGAPGSQRVRRVGFLLGLVAMGALAVAFA